jgi:monoamine oxidase
MIQRRVLLRSALAAACLPVVSQMAARSGVPFAPRMVSRAWGQGSGTDYDVLILGAGVAGLAAAATLLSYDDELKVLVLEARDRIGGRVYSLPHEALTFQVEFGASRIKHPDGLAWPPLVQFGLHGEADAEGRVAVLPAMTSLVDALAASSTGLVQRNSVVTEILWRQGLIGVYYRDRGLDSAVTARRLVCTLPAAVLASGQPSFNPPLPADKRAALAGLSPEAAVSVAQLLSADLSLPAWDDHWAQTDDYSFLRLRRSGSGGQWLLEAQYLGSRAAALAGQDEALLHRMARRDVEAAAAITLPPRAGWEAVYDWSAEPFSRSARTLAAAPSLHRDLAAPLSDTVFFAGEATAAPADVGTLHGAYASGERAGHEVARSLGFGAAEADAPLLELL